MKILCLDCGLPISDHACPLFVSIAPPVTVGSDFYNGIEWLACWLLDHAEGETITEEQLRPWAVAAWADHLKRANAPGDRPEDKPNGL